MVAVGGWLWWLVAESMIFWRFRVAHGGVRKTSVLQVIWHPCSSVSLYLYVYTSYCSAF